MREPTKPERDSGFTLIEMLIVTTIIGIIAGVTVPTLLSRRVTANEAAVIATLRAISSAQFQFQAMGELDLDYDSGYEYGTLGELGALDELRNSTEKIAKNLLSARVCTLDAAGHATHHGYHFALYLPDAAGNGVIGMPSNAGSIDAVQAKMYWTCVAWPIEVGTTGNRSFFVNQHGQCLKSKVTPYSGKANGPPAGAGLVGVAQDSIRSQTLATNMVGADGNEWIVVN